MTAPQKTCPQCGNAYDAEQRFCPRDGSTLRAPAGSDLVGSVVADRYLILKKIGEGGMGQVYLAEHIKMKRKSAVKVMHKGMVHDAEAVQRFNREASNASSIQHPHVAAIYDFGETPDGLIYLAMEYIDGEPLTRIIERQGALPAARAAEITRQVAEALEAAHEHGIVHRDLKPDNIMIARGRTGEDVVKVVDFGIAKAMSGDQQVTKTGLAVGTPEYMSPEQLGGDDLDARTDIYSLGLVSFNMFTGQLPFPAVTSREALIVRLTDKPRTLAEIRRDVQWPDSMQWVMDRALANHPGERYQHVGQFGRDLVRAVADMPGSALSHQGTLAVAGSAAARSAILLSSEPPTKPKQTQARNFGGSPEAVARRASAMIAAERRMAEEKTVPLHGMADERSSVPLYIGMFFAIAVLGGGGWWLSQRIATAVAPPVADAAVVTPVIDSAARADSISRAALAEKQARDSIARLDSLTRLATADSVAKAAAAAAVKPRLAPLPTPRDLAALTAPARDDLQVGNDRRNDGDYEMAIVRIGGAEDKVNDLLRRYPDIAELKALKREIADSAGATRAACKAEREDALSRGSPPPECP